MVKVGFDVIGVGVGAMIFNERGEVFLSQRGPKAKNERGTWEFPGGGVEFGEKLVDAIQREILEEYGMVIEIDSLLGVTIISCRMKASIGYHQPILRIMSLVNRASWSQKNAPRLAGSRWIICLHRCQSSHRWMCKPTGRTFPLKFVSPEPPLKHTVIPYDIRRVNSS